MGRSVLLVFVACTLIFSQCSTGRIDGNITDQTGAAIVGAKVTVTDVQRGVGRTLMTDTAGAYSAPNLIPGTYTVVAKRLCYADFFAIRHFEKEVGCLESIKSNCP